jgi:hypothetical protein
MDHVEAFHKNARECRAMAHSAKDPESRATWTSLAERWQHCAEVAESAMAAQQQRLRMTIASKN